MKLKTILLTGLVFMLSMGILFAATPSDILSNLTGLTEEQLIEEHLAGKTYGQIADDHGVLTEYHDAILTEKIDLINERVSDGTLTQEQATTLIERIQSDDLNCDPSDPDRIMSGYGMRFGGGLGNGNNENCLGTGTGVGFGNGNGGSNARTGGMGFGRFQNNN